MTTVQDMPDNWRTSSFSSQGGDCVEVAYGRRAVRVRDSKNRKGGVLTMSDGTFEAFTSAMKTAEFTQR